MPFAKPTKLALDCSIDISRQFESYKLEELKDTTKKDGLEETAHTMSGKVKTIYNSGSLRIGDTFEFRWDPTVSGVYNLKNTLIGKSKPFNVDGKEYDSFSISLGDQGLSHESSEHSEGSQESSVYSVTMRSTVASIHTTQPIVTSTTKHVENLSKLPKTLYIKDGNMTKSSEFVRTTTCGLVHVYRPRRSSRGADVWIGRAVLDCKNSTLELYREVQTVPGSSFLGGASESRPESDAVTLVG